MKCTKLQLTWEDDIKTFLQRLDVKAWKGLDCLMTDRSGLCTFRLLWSSLTKAWNNLRMKAASSSKETQIYQCPWYHIPEDTWSSPWRSEISRRRDVKFQSTWWPESNQKPKKKLTVTTTWNTTAYAPSFIHECIHKYIHMGCLYVRKHTRTRTHTHIYIHVFEKLIVLHTYIQAFIYLYTYIKYIEPHYVLSVYMHKHKTYQLIYTHTGLREYLHA
jgi:hypothetical protein